MHRLYWIEFAKTVLRLGIESIISVLLFEILNHLQVNFPLAFTIIKFRLKGEWIHCIVCYFLGNASVLSWFNDDFMSANGFWKCCTLVSPLWWEVVIANGWNGKCAIFIWILCGVLNIFNTYSGHFTTNSPRQQDLLKREI